MTTPDLFDTPIAPACRRCQAEVLRVHDDEIGIRVDLEPEPLPVTSPVPTDQVALEHHPTAGWHHPSSPRRRGYPFHLLHKCKPKTESENQP